MKKVAIIVGHNERREGAQAIYPLNQSEFDFNNSVAKAMLQAARGHNLELKIFNRYYQRSYSREIREVYARVNAWDADYSTELHFNSGPFTAKGTEVLSSGSSGSLKLANATQDILCEVFQRRGRENRKVKVRRKGSRGYLSLVAGSAPAIIPEPFFGSNRADVRKMMSVGVEGLAAAYVRAFLAI